MEEIVKAELPARALTMPDFQQRQHLRGKLERTLVSVTTGVVGSSYDIKGHEGADAAERGWPKENVTTDGRVALPPAWDSTLCMHYWGVPELQELVDPNGYIIFVNGRLARCSVAVTYLCYLDQC